MIDFLGGEFDVGICGESRVEATEDYPQILTPTLSVMSVHSENVEHKLISLLSKH